MKKYNKEEVEEINKDYENLSVPLLILNSQGSIIYKNKLAYSFKVFRLGTSFYKYVDSSGRYAYNLGEETEPAVLPLIPSLNASLAALFFDSAGRRVVYLILNSILMHEMLSKHDLEGEMTFHELNVNTARLFASHCQRAIKQHGISINEIILENTKRLIRAEKHFSMYIESTKLAMKTYVEYNADGYPDRRRKPDSSFYLHDFIRNLYDFAVEKCSALGYRLILEKDIGNEIANFSKCAFLSVFFSLVTLSLRSAEDYISKIFIGKGENSEIILTFKFRLANAADVFHRFTPDFVFISEICKFNNWHFTGIDNEGPYAVISVFFPPYNESLPGDNLKAPAQFKMSEAYLREIMEIELSILPDVSCPQDYLK